MARLAATLASIGGIAVTLSGCGSVDYDATETCNFQIPLETGPDACVEVGNGTCSCSIPNIKTGCCDFALANMLCGGPIGFTPDDEKGAHNECLQGRLDSMPDDEKTWIQAHTVPGQNDCVEVGNGMTDCGSKFNHLVVSEPSELIQFPPSDLNLWESVQFPRAADGESPWVPGLVGFAAGAAVVTAVVAFKKKRTPSELYAPLDEVTA